MNMEEDGANVTKEGHSANNNNSNDGSSGGSGASISFAAYGTSGFKISTSTSVNFARSFIN